MRSWFGKKETLEELQAKRERIQTGIDRELQAREAEVRNAKMNLEDRLFDIEQDLRERNAYLSTRSAEDRENLRRARRLEEEAIGKYNMEARDIILKSAPLIGELNDVNTQIASMKVSQNALNRSQKYITDMAKRRGIAYFDVPVHNPPPIEPGPNVRFEREMFERAIDYPRKIYTGLFGQTPPPPKY